MDRNDGNMLFDEEDDCVKESQYNYIQLKDLEVYRLARKLSEITWEIYEQLEWQDKKIMGDQFIQSVDSVGANIAEGYKRFHYLDKIKFYYTSRASLSEACHHWAELLCERKKISRDTLDQIKGIEEELSVKLSNFISTTYRKIKNN
jgi:four helix bundle protein